jgi:nucleoside-diphosphate-sugar epimerase
MSEAGTTAGQPRGVFLTGATGYIGLALVVALLERGHRARALVREQSRARLPVGAEPIIGDALRASTFSAALRPEETVVHLVGTPHPNPRKAAEFERIDLASILATVEAARSAGVTQLVYLSVA